MPRGVPAQRVAAAVALAAMVAYPLGRRGGGARRSLTSVVVGALHATTLIGVARRWGSTRALTAAATTVTAATALEHVGQRTGWPFGRYRYSPSLRPQVAGVPVLVPLAWFAMAVPARETAHAALGGRSNPASRIVGGAVAMTAWDVFLDPQMVGEGYWSWRQRGRYRGIPATNFAGWFVVSLLVMGLLEVILPPAEPAADLVAEYGVMATMETVGFAAFFDDRVVAALGGAAMLPIAAVAAVRSRR